MDRLTDLKRLMDIEQAHETKNEAEIAKLQGKIDKTLAEQHAADGALSTPEPDAGAVSTTPPPAAE